MRKKAITNEESHLESDKQDEPSVPVVIQNGVSEDTADTTDEAADDQQSGPRQKVETGVQEGEKKVVKEAEVGEVAAEQVVAEEPVPEEPVAEEPVPEEPVPEEPVAEEPEAA